jgi:predicted transcriptional regulator
MPTDPKKVWGTSGGVPITEEMIQEWVAEAERGYDLSQLRPVGRPALGHGPSAVVQVRVDDKLREALAARAAGDATTTSEIVRRALRAYLDVA